MLAAKSFEPISDLAAVERWVTILAEELAERMVADNKLFNRRPKSLHLHYRSAYPPVNLTAALCRLGLTHWFCCTNTPRCFNLF